MKIITGREFTARWYAPQFHVNDQRRLVAVEEKSGDMPDGSGGTWTVLYLEDGTRESTGRYTKAGSPGLYYPVRVDTDWAMEPIGSPLKV